MQGQQLLIRRLGFPCQTQVHNLLQPFLQTKALPPARACSASPPTDPPALRQSQPEPVHAQPGGRRRFEPSAQVQATLAAQDGQLLRARRKRSPWRFRVAALASASPHRSSAPGRPRWRMPSASAGVGRLATKRCHKLGCGAGASRRTALRMKASMDAGGSPPLC